ncbi:SDR family oxidoreductase [Gammaproteobacteria bacterium]|nr:SDR family oxidoreductase [Gammaproteobacteria bacterium]
MNKKLNTALVIGGNGGIGIATVSRLLDDGFFVVATYNNNKEKLETLAQNHKSSKNLKYIKLNTTSLDDVQLQLKKVINSNDKIDVIVLSISGAYKNIRIFDLKWIEIANFFENQVQSLYNIHFALKEQIKEKVRTKYIVLLSDVCFGSPPKGFAHYVSAKYALFGFAKSLSLELSTYGSTLNMISPGMVETEMLVNMPRKLLEINASQNPLERNGLPEDVSSVISFLASDKSDYLNGINVPVNGGSKLL